MEGLLPIIRRKRRPLIDVDGAIRKPEGGGICPPESPSPVPDVSAPVLAANSVVNEANESNEKGERGGATRKRIKSAGARDSSAA